MKKIFDRLIFIGLVPLMFAACSDATSEDETPASPIVINDNNGADYNPVIDPANFVSTIDNPYFTLSAGRSWSYEGSNDDGEPERILVEVTQDTKTIQGISMTVVRDRVWEDDELVEDTYDWFAQDSEGTVWYFGEAVDNYEDGVLKDHEGAWEAGVNGARAGIAMKANPQVGDVYRQELLPGEAEDMGEVLSTGVSVTIGIGSYQNCIVIKDWTPLEADIEEHKTWCPAVGNVVLEKKVAGESGSIELKETQ
ncbi:MAG: hypothetical protein HQM13_20690 [SAR324 cluster bacterium]|nr:hypothetical protein [SAR324 cluster bacterium]